MKRLLFISTITLIAGLANAGEPLVRNPFWPHGYQGRRYPIADTPRYPSKAPTAAATEPSTDLVTAATNELESAQTQVADSYTVEDAENAMWKDACSTMRFSDACTYEIDGHKIQSLRINGRLYKTDDLVSINHGSRRFTWQFQGLGTNDLVQLIRIRQRELSYQEQNVNQSLNEPQGN